MFLKARLKLTILYSIIFLVLFWTLSGGVYEWMNWHFGDQERREFNRYSRLEPTSLRESPSDAVMDELRNTLIVLDILLFILIPPIIWFLTRRTLTPVQEAHEREKQFFTDASHDLRTPLTILQGEIDLALQKDQTTTLYKKTLQSNKEEVTSLIDLVENMLFFARDSKKNQPKQSLDITDIVLERVSKFQHLAKKNQLSLYFTPPTNSLIVLGNKQLLQRLMTSLLDNAIKYTPQKGKIDVTISQEKQHAVIAIADTGIGISQEQMEKVFDRFYRTDAARSQKGYGLGLSIAKQIVDFHDGKISITSTKGHGTTIMIRLPVFTPNKDKNFS